jgi:hypothetical protein
MAVRDLVPEPGNFSLPVALYQDVVIVLEPEAPATVWPAALASIKLIVGLLGEEEEYEADLTSDPSRGVIKVEYEVSNAWPNKLPWTIQMNWDGLAPIYNQVPANGVVRRVDPKRARVAS